MTVRSLSRFGLGLGLAFSDLEFYGNGGVGELEAFILAPFEFLALPSPPPQSLHSAEVPQSGWAGFLFKTQVCFALLAYLEWPYRSES